MFSIDFWQYWWYVSPIIFALGCMIAGYLSLYGVTDDVGITLIITIALTIIWPIAIYAAPIIIVGVSMYKLGRWIAKKIY